MAYDSKDKIFSSQMVKDKLTLIPWSNASDSIIELVSFWTSFYDPPSILQTTARTIGVEYSQHRKQTKITGRTLWTDFMSTWCSEGSGNFPSLGTLQRPSKGVCFLKFCRQHAGLCLYPSFHSHLIKHLYSGGEHRLNHSVVHISGA